MEKLDERMKGKCVALVAWFPDTQACLVNESEMQEMCGEDPPWIIGELSCPLCGHKELAIMPAGLVDLETKTAICANCDMGEARVEGL